MRFTALSPRRKPMDSLAGQFFCPHCGAENPPFDFAYNSGGEPLLKVAFVTVICGGIVAAHHCRECKGRGVIRDYGLTKQCPACEGTRLIPERTCRRILS